MNKTGTDWFQDCRKNWNLNPLVWSQKRKIDRQIDRQIDREIDGQIN